MLKPIIFEELETEFLSLLKNDGYSEDFINMTFLPTPVELGIYVTTGFNLGNYMTNLKSEYSQSDKFRDALDIANETDTAIPESMLSNKGDYGVCDNIEQVKQYYSEQILDTNADYAISLSWIEHNEDCDWRWHKWGEYIGLHDKRCEHLRDETDIDGVYCFHLYELY